MIIDINAKIVNLLSLYILININLPICIKNSICLITIFTIGIIIKKILFYILS